MDWIKEKSHPATPEANVSETPAEGEGPEAVTLTTARTPPGEAPTTPNFNSPAGDEAPTQGGFADAPAEGHTPMAPTKAQIPAPTDMEIKIPAAPAIPAEAEVHNMSKEDENPPTTTEAPPTAGESAEAEKPPTSFLTDIAFQLL